jgi:hypothetical protein
MLLPGRTHSSELLSIDVDAVHIGWHSSRIHTLNLALHSCVTHGIALDRESIAGVAFWFRPTTYCMIDSTLLVNSGFRSVPRTANG